jgi:lipid-A-disaccharide synthase
VSRSDPRIGMVAGETSGDLLAGLLLGGMKARWPDLSSQGIGGPKMAAQGFEAWWPHEKLAVHGFNMEVLRRFREIWTGPTCSSGSMRPTSTSAWKPA